MKHLLITLGLLTFSLGTYAKCEPVPGKSVVSWTGYKLAKKVGVKGQFTDVKIQGIPGKSMQDYIRSASFSINAKKMNSGDKGRDIKIANFFFGNFKGGPTIKGFVSKIENNKVHVMFNMNEVNKEIALDMAVKEKTVTLTGKLDFMDFLLDKSYKAISKACSIKHEGKTWAEAGLEIVSTFNDKCS